MVDKLLKLEKLFVKYPASVRFVRLASLYLDNGRHEDAILLCEKGCEKNNNSAMGYYMLAMSYFSKGDFERAYLASSRSKSLLPDNPSGLKLHAEICSALGNFEGAIHNFRLACRLDPFGKSVSEKVKELERKIITESADFESSHPVEESDPSICNNDDSRGPSLASVGIVSNDSKLITETHKKFIPKMSKGDKTTDGSYPKENQSHLTSKESQSSLVAPYNTNKSEDHIVVTPEDLVAQSIETTYADTGQVEKCQISHIFDTRVSESRTSFVKRDIAVPKSDNADELTDKSDFSDNSLVTNRYEENYSVTEEKREQDLFHLFQEIETGSGGVVDVALLPDKQDYGVGEDEKNISTRTLADIYILQGLTEKAIEIYEKLLEDDPENVGLRKKLSVLRSVG